MPYTFEAQETLADAVRRVATEELESALSNLRGSDSDRDERVHEIRKSLKKLRALLRLFRAELGGAAFQHENATFREIGRKLSAARDLAALAGAIDKLSEAFGERAQPLQSLRAKLLESKASAEHEQLTPELLEHVESELRAALSRVADWPLGEPGWKALDRGLRKTYARGQAAFELAYDEPSADHFHDWRKRAKDHLYHVRLLARLWPEPMKGLRAALDELAELLGDDHDLAVLEERVRAQLTNGSADDEITAITTLLREHSDTLRRKAKTAGARAYAERPQAFARRMRAYYRAFRSEAGAASEPQPEPDATPAPDAKPEAGDR